MLKHLLKNSALGGWIILCVLFGLFPAHVYADQYSISWIDTLDNDSTDTPKAMCVDKSGNIYITGRSYLDSTVHWLTVKYSPTGNIINSIWMDTTTGNFSVGQGIASYNNFVVNSGTIQNDSNSDWLIVRYDSNSNILWADTIDNGNDDYGQGGISVDRDGNYIAFGNSVIGGNFDWLLIKYDSSGNLTWKDTLDMGYDDGARDIAIDSANNIIVTGTIGTGSYYYKLLVKYSPSGSVLWMDTLETLYSGGRSVATDPDLNIIVAGFILYSDYFLSPILKYDQNGNMIWADTLDSIEIRDVSTDKNGNIVVTGSTYDSSYNYNYITIKYDPNGNILWADTIDNGDRDNAIAVFTDTSTIIITGASFINNNYDWLTVKYESTTGIKEKNIDKKVPVKLRVCPSVIKNKSTILYYLPEKEKVNLSLYNLLGQQILTLVNKEQEPGNHRISWTSESLLPGIYFCRLSTSLWTQTTKIVVIY